MHDKISKSSPEVNKSSNAPTILTMHRGSSSCCSLCFYTCFSLNKLTLNLHAMPYHSFSSVQPGMVMSRRHKIIIRLSSQYIYNFGFRFNSFWLPMSEHCFKRVPDAFIKAKVKKN